MVDKIAIYTGLIDYDVAKGILKIANDHPDLNVRVFLNHKTISLKKKLRLQWKNLQKNGVYRLLEIGSIITNSLYKKLFFKQYKQYGCQQITDFIYLLKNHESISICNVYDINSQDSVIAIKDFSPCLGISLAAPILKKQVLDIAKKGNLNLHKGKLPLYRGMPPAFWEVKNGEVKVGCTVHLISELLDEGDILLESEVGIDKWSTPKGLKVQLDELGIKLMAKAVTSFISGDVSPIKQQGNANTYTKPTLQENKKLIKRIAKKDNNPLIKRILKTIIFNIYTSIYAPINAYFKGKLGKQDVIVLLYHRVNDFQRDSLTVGVEQFSEQMQYIKNNFPVASLKSLIDGEISRNEKKPIIVVTFDDGYLDNYQNAFPICLKEKVPCSFFVSTDMIDSGESFPHDNNLDIKLENMNWSQLREMKTNGMFIGSHTCNHLNCADANEVELQYQFDSSQSKLNEKLGIDTAILAYPFGGKEHFNFKAQEQAIGSGYVAILSAYGGVNKELDFRDIKRGGIDWMFNKSSFKATLFGWRR